MVFRGDGHGQAKIREGFLPAQLSPRLQLRPTLADRLIGSRPSSAAHTAGKVRVWLLS